MSQGMNPNGLNSSLSPDPAVGSTRLVRRYRVEWQHKHPIWGIVEASTKQEAIQKARRGEFIGEVDSDPGKDDWRNPDVQEQSPNTNLRERVEAARKEMEK